MTWVYNGDDGEPLWSQNMMTNEGGFNDHKSLGLSLKPRVAEAKGELLLAALGGTGLTVTGAGLYKFLSSKSDFKDWRVRAAILVGGVTGYSVGYWFAVHSIGNDSPEILAFLRNKENLNKIKRLIFVSMAQSGQLKYSTAEYTEDELKVINSECNPTDRIACLSALSEARLEIALKKLKLYEDTIRRLSSDDYIIKAEDFLVFFILAPRETTKKERRKRGGFMCARQNLVSWD